MFTVEICFNKFVSISKTVSILKWSCAMKSFWCHKIKPIYNIVKSFLTNSEHIKFIVTFKDITFKINIDYKSNFYLEYSSETKIKKQQLKLLFMYSSTQILHVFYTKKRYRVIPSSCTQFFNSLLWNLCC